MAQYSTRRFHSHSTQCALMSLRKGIRASTLQSPSILFLKRYISRINKICRFDNVIINIVVIVIVNAFNVVVVIIIVVVIVTIESGIVVLFCISASGSIQSHIRSTVVKTSSFARSAEKKDARTKKS